MTRGFTLMELAISLSITALVVPAAWSFARALEEPVARGHWHLDCAVAVRAVAEMLERDRSAPACVARYELQETSLVRIADARCGGSLVLATDVAQFERGDDGVRLVFERRWRPEHSTQTRFFIPLEAP